MTFRVRVSAVAQAQIDKFVDYLRGYSEEFAVEQINQLDRVFSVNLRESPLTWAHFAFTGAPYRGYLFRVGRRTQYWIVYTVDEDLRTVDVLHFWNASRDPGTIDF
jgi:mRNA-degrading endonuclease RelE of RelBE toxin-antitoxin system